MAVYIRPGRPCRLAIEFFFQAAQAIVVDANVAQHLRGELIVGIEALELLLEVDALHVEGLDRGCNLRRHAPRDPGEVTACVEPGCDLRLGGERVFRIGVDQMTASVRAAACLSAICVGSA